MWYNGSMKTWFKKFGIGILLGLAVIFLSAWLAYTIAILKSDPQLASAYVAVGTLILALVTALLALFTWLSIRSGEEREERNREERLLKEIIEWAQDIAGCNMTVNPESVTQIAGSQGEREYHHAVLCDFANRLQAIRGKSLYAKSITSSEAFKQYENLNISVADLIKKLEAYIKSILGCTDILYRNGKSSDLRKEIDKSGNLRVELETSAYKVIEEVTALLC